MKNMRNVLMMAGFSVVVALAYGNGKEPGFSRILSLIPADFDNMEMTVHATSPEDAYPEATTDLVAGSWDRIAHSANPLPFEPGGDFVETNLLYSVESDTNVVIYVKADENAKFFRIVQ